MLGKNKVSTQKMMISELSSEWWEGIKQMVKGEKDIQGSMCSTSQSMKVQQSSDWK